MTSGVPAAEDGAVAVDEMPRQQQQEAAAVEQQQELPLVLLLRPLFPLFEEVLSKNFRFLKPWEAEKQPGAPPATTSRDGFLAAHADSIRAILCSGPTTVDAPTIALLPRLRCVVATSAGVNQIDLDECRRRGIAVANAGTVFSEDTADYAVGLLIDVLRRISAADRFVRGRLWPVRGGFLLGSK